MPQIPISADVHAYVKEVAKERGTTLQGVAEYMIAYGAAKADLDCVDFPAPKPRGRKPRELEAETSQAA